MKRIAFYALLCSTFLAGYVVTPSYAELNAAGKIFLTPFAANSIKIRSVTGHYHTVFKGGNVVPVRIPSGRLVWNDGMDLGQPISNRVNFIRAVYPANSDRVVVFLFEERPDSPQVTAPPTPNLIAPNPVVYGPAKTVRIDIKQAWTRSFRVTIQTVIGSINVNPGQTREFPVQWGMVPFFDGNYRNVTVPVGANWVVVERDYQGNIYWSFFRR